MENPELTHKLDFDVIDLTSENNVVNQFETPPSKRVLGGDKADIEQGKIKLYIGNRPTTLNLKKLYAQLGKDIPAEIELFKSYNAYILTHRVGIMKEGGFKSVDQVGYRVRFSEDEPVIVLDLMPQAKFVKKFESNFKFDAELSINGQLGIPEKVTEFLENNIEYATLGGKFKAATNNTVVGRFSFSVQTPEIMAIGKGNTYSEWVFSKMEAPLYGSDIEMCQIILVDRFVTSISFEAKAYCVISTWNLLPARRESDWIQLACTLE